MIEKSLKTYSTSARTFLNITLALVVISAVVSGHTFFTKPEAMRGILILLAFVWAFVFFSMSRFRLEITSETIRYRKLFGFREIQIKEVASFCSGEKRPLMKRNISFEILMKPGIEPKKHEINFKGLPNEGQQQLLKFFQVHGIKEEP